jgi:hypothetical protein
MRAIMKVPKAERKRLAGPWAQAALETEGKEKAPQKNTTAGEERKQDEQREAGNSAVFILCWSVQQQRRPRTKAGAAKEAQRGASRS